MNLIITVKAALEASQQKLKKMIHKKHDTEAKHRGFLTDTHKASLHQRLHNYVGATKEHDIKTVDELQKLIELEHEVKMAKLAVDIADLKETVAKETQQLQELQTVQNTKYDPERYDEKFNELSTKQNFIRSTQKDLEAWQNLFDRFEIQYNKCKSTFVSLISSIVPDAVKKAFVCPKLQLEVDQELLKLEGKEVIDEYAKTETGETVKAKRHVNYRSHKRSGKK